MYVSIVEFELRLIPCNFIMKFRNINSCLLFLNASSCDNERATGWWEVTVRLPLCSSKLWDMKTYEGTGTYFDTVWRRMVSFTPRMLCTPYTDWRKLAGHWTGLNSVQGSCLCFASQSRGKCMSCRETC